MFDLSDFFLQVQDIPIKFFCSLRSIQMSIFFGVIPEKLISGVPHRSERIFFIACLYLESLGQIPITRKNLPPVWEQCRLWNQSRLERGGGGEGRGEGSLRGDREGSLIY